MQNILVILFVLVVFSIVPGVLLGMQYNLAVGVAYTSISITLTQIFWDLGAIEKQLKDNAKKT